MELTIYTHEHLPMHAENAPGEGRASARLPLGRAPRVGVIFNARSHHNKQRQPDAGNHPDVFVARPATREDIAHALAGFAEKQIDYLVISGGDGTVRDVLTMGQSVFGDHWPQLAVLPRGKTNALNVDLGSPADWNLKRAIAAFASGRRITHRPLAVSRIGSREPPMFGFIIGAGAFTLGVEAGQDAHRIGFFNSLAVGMTSAWGVLQGLFGSDNNRWRRGTKMELTYQPSGDPFPHSHYGDPSRRSVMLASTLERMPIGIKLFGKGLTGIRISLLDKPRRRLLASLPAVLAGWHPRWLAPAGLHHLCADGFSLDIEAPFILDGEHFPPGNYLVERGPELTFVCG